MSTAQTNNDLLIELLAKPAPIVEHRAVGLSQAEQTALLTELLTRALSPAVAPRQAQRKRRFTQARRLAVAAAVAAACAVAIGVPGGTAQALAAPTAAYPVAGQTYYVVSGDTLESIAWAAYGNGDLWTLIWDANAAQIPDPHWIYPGQALYIPASGQYVPPGVGPAGTPGGTYVVQSGDTLSGISLDFYGTAAYYPSIANYNGLPDPNFIVTNQVLGIPSNPQAYAYDDYTTASYPPQNASGVNSYYTVQSGDTLSGIAFAYYGNADLWPTIQAANGLPDPNFIVTGEVLYIP